MLWNYNVYKDKHNDLFINSCGAYSARWNLHFSWLQPKILNCLFLKPPVGGISSRRCMAWAFSLWTQLHIAELSYRCLCRRGEASLLCSYSNWGGIFTLCIVPEITGTMISLAQLLRWWFHAWRFRKDLKLFPSTPPTMEYSVLRAIVPLREKRPLSPSLAPEMCLRDFAWMVGRGREEAEKEASHKTDSPNFVPKELYCNKLLRKSSLNQQQKQWKFWWKRIGRRLVGSLA